MAKSLKQKTVSGLMWSFIDNVSKQGLTFVIGIILARLLSPDEFGLIGMITIFIAVSTSVVDSGFSQALIRKKDCTDTDYSTVFYFNLLAGIFLTTILFFAAPLISRFFEEPQLNKLVKVVSVVLVIDALSLIQRTKLIKRVDFKLQTKVSVIATALGGALGIALAVAGFGVWSLVAKQIGQRLISAILLWFWNKWKPLWVFSKKSFKELFGFGSKLLVSGLLNTIYRNIYLLVIGKYFSASQLGYFTRAEQFKKLPAENMMRVIQRVTYPVLSDIQDDIPRLIDNYRKLIKSTMFITFILMLGMAAAAKPMILTLIGEKWLPSVIFLQLLCLEGMFYPLSALNLNMLKVQGYSHVILKLEVFKKILAVPVIIIGIIYGINILIIGMVIHAAIAYYLNGFYSGKMLNYSIKDQLLDILPSFLLASAMGLVVLVLGNVLHMIPVLKFIIQVLSAIVFIIGIGELTKFKDYLFVKDIIIQKLNYKK